VDRRDHANAYSTLALTWLSKDGTLKILSGARVVNNVPEIWAVPRRGGLQSPAVLKGDLVVTDSGTCSAPRPVQLTVVRSGCKTAVWSKRVISRPK